MKTRKEKINEFLGNLSIDIDIVYHVNNEYIDSFDSIYQSIDEDQGFDVDVIYYSNAIEYLKENDPSLNLSLELASDMGYETKAINSELLASLLKSQNIREEFNELEEEINEFLEGL